MKSETKTCQNCKNEFIVEPEDFEFYARIKVPPPTFCPECRLIRRLVWRNESRLYRRKCQAPGHSEEIISTFSPDKSFTVYDVHYWWSDAWGAESYGIDIDFSRPFLEQLKELLQRVPKPHMTGDYTTMVRSEYSNWAGHLKNCYLIFDADYIEDSAYGTGISRSKDCFDVDTSFNCESCKDGFDLMRCNQTISSVSCRECTGVYFSKDCIGCTSCFGCVNLRNKSYYIFNKAYSKEEYFDKFLGEFNLGSYQNYERLHSEASLLSEKIPKKYFHGFHNVNVDGDYITYSKNTSHSFLITGVEDSKFVVLTHEKPTKDCYDYTDWGENAQRVYEGMTVGLGADDVKFSSLIFKSGRNIEYSYFCLISSNLFGCHGLKNKQYCILNKQYSKEDYEKLVPRIIEHMNSMPYIDKKGRIYKYGEFFPPELSPFAYNETIAQEYFPLTKEQALEQGYSWRDPEIKDVKITIKAEDLPDHIKDIKDDILQQIVGCAHEAKCNEQCTLGFKIIPQELEFYRKMNLSLPRLCPNCRHYQRLKQRNPLKLWHRNCTCAGIKDDKDIYQNTAKHFHGDGHCPNEFETSYAPERPEIVYCEQCYNSEVA